MALLLKTKITNGTSSIQSCLSVLHMLLAGLVATAALQLRLLGLLLCPPAVLLLLLPLLLLAEELRCQPAVTILQLLLLPAVLVRLLL